MCVYGFVSARAHLSIEGVAKDLPKLLGVHLRLASLRGIENGGLDSLGQRLPEQLTGELDGSKNGSKHTT